MGFPHDATAAQGTMHDEIEDEDGDEEEEEEEEGDSFLVFTARSSGSSLPPSVAPDAARAPASLHASSSRATARDAGGIEGPVLPNAMDTLGETAASTLQKADAGTTAAPAHRRNAQPRDDPCAPDATAREISATRVVEAPPRTSLNMPASLTGTFER